MNWFQKSVPLTTQSRRNWRAPLPDFDRNKYVEANLQKVLEYYMPPATEFQKENKNEDRLTILKFFSTLFAVIRSCPLNYFHQ